ncbi:acyl-CoA dehydrogenase family protein [Natronoglycomyces albus]|uniref:Acyl-CoA dehydrogenase n=1 Tax=Natronoglycomyces albus TaxID=2811108 RepID=A0A895XTA6_9ACTN|nr:acyl-CoA dehydrogenase [Natronoglycomyces albus]QSB06882.1 acyl-CoA dehydrogenase [Natronoglycomyces albus]
MNPTPRPAFDADLLSTPLYTDEHRSLATELDNWCRERRPAWEKLEEDNGSANSRQLLSEIAQANWLAHLEKPGPPDMRAMCLRREILAYHCDVADFAYAIQELSAAAISYYGEGEQRRTLMDLATGRSIGAFVLSEPEAGSDLAAVTTTATKTDAGYLIDGTKTWIAQGDVADTYIVLARTGEGPGPLGLTMFIVPAHNAGITVEPIDLCAPRSWAQIRFDKCDIGPEAVLGGPGLGFVVAMDVVERFRMTVGGVAQGLARRAQHLALERARNRPAYQGKLSELQLVKAALADMSTELSAATKLTAHAAWKADTGGQYVRDAASAKLYASEAAGRAVDAAVQIFGAAGLQRGSEIERLYRQARSLRLYEGPSELLRMTIAEAM